MNGDWVEILVALVIAMPGIIGLLLQVRNYKALAIKDEKEAIKFNADANKADKEAADQLIDSALSLTTPLREENTRLGDRNKYLEKGVKTLLRQLKKAGIEPEFDPTNGNGQNN